MVEHSLAIQNVAGSNLGQPWTSCSHTCLCRQAVRFGTGQWAVTLFSWEGNRRHGGK